MENKERFDDNIFSIQKIDYFMIISHSTKLIEISPSTHSYFFFFSCSESSTSMVQSWNVFTVFKSTNPEILIFCIVFRNKSILWSPPQEIRQTTPSSSLFLQEYLPYPLRGVWFLSTPEFSIDWSQKDVKLSYSIKTTLSRPLMQRSTLMTLSKRRSAVYNNYTAMRTYWCSRIPSVCLINCSDSLGTKGEVKIDEEINQNMDIKIMEHQYKKPQGFQELLELYPIHSHVCYQHHRYIHSTENGRCWRSISDWYLWWKPIWYSLLFLFLSHRNADHLCGAIHRRERQLLCKDRMEPTLLPSSRQEDWKTTSCIVIESKTSALRITPLCKPRHLIRFEQNKTKTLIRITITIAVLHRTLLILVNIEPLVQMLVMAAMLAFITPANPIVQRNGI